MVRALGLRWHAAFAIARTSLAVARRCRDESGESEVFRPLGVGLNVEHARWQGCDAEQSRKRADELTGRWKVMLDRLTIGGRARRNRDGHDVCQVSAL